MSVTVVLGQQGRLVIPAEMRAALGLSPGDHLELQLSGRRLLVERRGDAASRLRGFVTGVPRSRSLVDELIADRRAEAEAEAEA